MIKKYDKTNFPRLLQTIESKLILHHVTKRIALEQPKLPLFTIHDSVVTTQGNELYVKSVLEEEMLKAIGYKPKLSLELWHPKNLQFKDQVSYWGEELVAA